MRFSDKILPTPLSKDCTNQIWLLFLLYRDKANVTIKGANTEATSDITVIMVLREAQPCP